MLSASACSHRLSEDQIVAQRAAVHAALQQRPSYVGGDSASLGSRSTQIWNQTRAFYGSHDYALLWSDGTKPNARVEDLASAIARASEDGLDPHDYDLGTFDPARPAYADV